MNLGEAETSVGKSDGVCSSYRHTNVSPSLYQAEKQESNIFPPPSFSCDEKWVKEYKEQFGQEPSFF